LLKEARPDLEIGVVAETNFAEVFVENPAITKILGPDWQVIRKWKPLVCVNLHGGTRSQWLTMLAGARWRAGFAHHRPTFAYNLKIPRAQEIMGVEGRVHTAEHLASAFFALGVSLRAVPRSQLFTTEPLLAERHAVLHPYASCPEKQWPAERFCEVARYLRLWNITPVFLAGPDDDPTPFRNHRVLQSKLSEVKSLLADAALFVGNDSGPAHIAAAFGVPSVVLFSTSDPTVWKPWQTESEIVVSREGFQSVSVSRVIAAIERLRAFAEAPA